MKTVSFTSKNEVPFRVSPHPALKEKLDQELERLSGISNKNVRWSTKSRPGLNDGLIYPGQAFPLGTRLESVRSAALEKAPLKGVVRVIVVLIEFADMQFSKPASHFDDLFFSSGQIPTGSVRDYFNEVSNNSVDITGQVIGPFRLPHDIAYYANGASGTGYAYPNARTMALDTVIAADTAVNFSGYDNDRDGFVDAFVIVHAGTGAETTGNPDQIWSHKWVLPEQPYRTNDGTRVYGYLTVPEDCRMGVCAHELGHLLFGFPDLYDSDGSSSGIGSWCLMSGGSWNGQTPGDTPAHPSAWCKAMQGWVRVEMPRTNRQNVSIESLDRSNTIFKLWKNGIPGKEYFLMENRQQQGFDQFIPSGGLLIWHIDDTVADNTNEAHYRVALLQADGNRELENGINSGDSGDVYPGAMNNLVFDKNSNPHSYSYSGADTAVAVRIRSVQGTTYIVELEVV